MNDDEFWDLISCLEGSLDESGLARLRSALAGLRATDLKQFDATLHLTSERLATIAVVDELGVRAVGDAAHFMRLTAIAKGRSVIQDALIGAGPLVVAEDWSLAEEFELAAREIFEESTGQAWPEDWRLVSARMGTVYASIPMEHAQTPFIKGVEDSLAALRENVKYRRAALSAGLVYVEYMGRLFIGFGNDKPGNWWRARRSDRALLITFSIDERSTPHPTYDQGAAFVRDMVDDVGRRRGLPLARDVFGP